MDRGGTTRFLALGCIGLLTGAAPALAQEAGGAAQPPKVLGAVTVTDTAISEGSYKTERPASPKYTAPLLDTPRTVTVIPAQVLQDNATASLADALRFVPGVTLGAGEGGNPQGDRPFIRGADSQNSLFLDGVRDVGAQSRDVFAIDQIEVVKGPDSTMNGRGSVGGAINMVSKQPTTERLANFTAATGTAEYRRLTADVNQPIGNVGLRLAAMYHDQHVAGRDAVWQDRWGVAPSVKFGLSGPTSLTLDYYHLESHDLPDSGIPYLYSTLNAPNGYSETTVAQTPRTAFYGLVNRDFRRTLVNTGTARLEHKFANGLTLRNTTRYGVSSQGYVLTQPDDSQGNVLNGLVWRRANSRYSRTTGFFNQTDFFGTFTLGGIKNSFAITGEVSRETANVGNYVSNASTGAAIATGINAPGGRCGPASIAAYNCTSLADPNPYDPWVSYTADGSGVPAAIMRSAERTWNKSRANTQAVSVFDTVNFSDALLLNLGLRYDHYVTRLSPGLAATAADESGRAWFSRTDNIWTWQAGLTWKPAPNGSIYASASTAATPPGSYLGNGSESNALNTTSQAITDSLKVERTRSYEVGTKWNLFGEGLSLTLAAFQSDTNNARAVDANGTVTFVGKKRIKGIEFTASGNITDRWNVFGGYTYMDSTIRDGGFASVTVNGIAFVVPSPSTGQRFPNTPDHSFVANTTYKATDRLSLGANALYMSKVYGGYGAGIADGVVTKTLARYVPSFWRFDANATFQVTPRFSLQANVNNLFDKRYYDKAYNSHFASQAAGRTAILTANVKL